MDEPQDNKMYVHWHYTTVTEVPSSDTFGEKPHQIAETAFVVLFNFHFWLAQTPKQTPNKYNGTADYIIHFKRYGLKLQIIVDLA